MANNIIDAKVFEDALQEIAALGFPKHAEALRTCNIVAKPWWMPWKGMSTTLNGTIYLGKEWRNWNLVQHLAHEATHLLQQRNMGMPAFLAAYAQKSGRLRLEEEAYQVECHALWRMTGYAWANVQFAINRVIEVLSTKYNLGSWYTQERMDATAQKLMEDL